MLRKTSVFTFDTKLTNCIRLAEVQPDTLLYKHFVDVRINNGPLAFLGTSCNRKEQITIPIAGHLLKINDEIVTSLLLFFFRVCKNSKALDKC